MSHDGLFILREKGRQTYFYDRWAGLSVDSLLLSGPAEVTATIRNLRQTTEPFAESWLSGAVSLDLDHRELLYWANQFFGNDPMVHGAYAALLRRVWPGFSCRWASQPLADFARALGRPLGTEDRMRGRMELLDPKGWTDLFDRAWRHFTTEPADQVESVRQWIADVGEDEVRRAAEDGNNVWVTVRDLQGRIHRRRCGHWELEKVFRAGPALAEQVAAGEELPSYVPETASEMSDLVELDLASRRLIWWSDIPDWRGTAELCGPLWPGWQVEHNPDGPKSFASRNGLDWARLVPTHETLKAALSEQLNRTLSNRVDPLVLLAREAARLQAENPGAVVTVNTDATSSKAMGPAAPPDSLLSLLDEVVSEVVAPQTK
jgi:hypothetical protein